jgi:hypothetical protein
MPAWAKAFGPATRKAREEVFFRHPSGSGGPGVGQDPYGPGFPLSRELRARLTIGGLDALAGADEVDPPRVRRQEQALREAASVRGRDQDKGTAMG